MSLLPASPLDDDWKIPPGSGPKFLLMYLRQQQKEAYGAYYTGLSHSILLRNMKLLCKEFAEDDIKRTIAWICSDENVKHPFSTKLIKQRITWLLAIRSSPMTVFYQNKS